MKMLKNRAVTLLAIATISFAHNPSYSHTERAVEPVYNELSQTRELRADDWRDLHSLKGAPATFLLDFDGGTFYSEAWGVFNDDNPNFTLAGINHNNVDEKAIWDGASEYFRPFNIDVTTDTAYFNEQPEHLRVRVIISPDAVFLGSSASLIKTFGISPVPFVSIYTQATNTWRTALTIAHEVGHTLGLFHDNEYNSNGYDDYFSGGAWGPIMGGYGYGVTQWSKGEYLDAGNREDDIDIIASVRNGFGIRPDDHQNSFEGATELNVNGTTILDSGIIETRNDGDAFYFKLSSNGSINLAVKTNNAGSSLDSKLTLFKSDGSTVKISAPTQNVNVSIISELTAGEYYLLVEGDSWDATFDTDYGSLGSYELTGSILGVDVSAKAPTNEAPVIVDSDEIHMQQIEWNAVDPITLSFDISDSDGSIESSQLVVDKDTIEISGSIIHWTPSRFEEHLLKFRAEDNSGSITEKFISVDVITTQVKTVSSESVTAIDFSSQSDSPTSVKAFASYSCDGDTGTTWSTLSSDYLDFTTGEMIKAGVYPHFITYDLGEERSIEMIAINYLSATDLRRAKNYQIFGSNNGSDWEEVTDTVLTNSGYDNDIVSIDQKKFRYFKWEAYESITVGTSAAFVEISFYETGDQTSINITGSKSVASVKINQISQSELAITTSQAEQATVELYTLSGRQILSLKNHQFSSGVNAIQLNGISAGAYMFRIKGENLSLAQKLILQ